MPYPVISYDKIIFVFYCSLGVNFMRDIILTSFSEDQFGRKCIAENLTKIILTKNESLVISLDSEWGTGKTTFVQMWKDMLNNDEEYKEHFETIYFNAWEHDYIKDPLLAILSQIQSEITKDNTKQKLKTIFNKSKPLLKVGLSSLIKLSTAGILNLDNVNLGDITENELIDLTTKIGEQSIQEILKEKDIRETFKHELATFQKKDNKRIVFFIDELDRCRPTFAIELLEVIKHLFDIDNFTFIVSIDKEQLSHSVATIYGQNMDTVGYLRRFFDLDYKLPKVDLNKYIQIKNEKILPSYSNIKLLTVFLEELMITYNFSLRDIEKLYYYLDILLPQIPEFKLDSKKCREIYIATISYIYANLIILKIKKPILYKKIMNCNYTVDEIMKEIKPIDVKKYDKIIGEGWHTAPLQKFIEPILDKYLSLNLKTNTPDWHQRICSSEEFVVKLTNEQGNLIGGWDNQLDLIHFFTNTGSNINSKLEFINNFEQN